MKSVLKGLFLHVLGNVIIKIFILKEIGFLISLLGLFLIIRALLFSKKIKPFRGLQKNLFYLLFLTYFIMIVRGYLIDYQFVWIRFEGFLNYHLVDQLYILPYFLPLLLFIKLDKNVLKVIFKTNQLINLIFITVSILSINNIISQTVLLYSGETQSRLLVNDIFTIYSSIAFFVLLKNYIPKNLWFLNITSFLIFFVLAILSGRRGPSLSGLFLIVGVIFFIFPHKLKKIKFMAFTFLILIIAYLAFVVKDNFIFNYLLNERGFENNRTLIDESMLQQMTQIELFFGKGLNGRYYLPLLDDDYLGGWRYGSETGFYNLVLKGGYFLAFLYVFILLISVYKGFFKSKNDLSKIFAFYILLSVIELYPFGWPEFTFKFIFIWFGALLCSNNYFLKLRDYQIKSFVKTNT